MHAAFVVVFVVKQTQETASIEGMGTLSRMFCRDRIRLGNITVGASDSRHSVVSSVT